MSYEPKYKIGQRVRITYDIYTYGLEYKGKIAKVVDIKSVADISYSYYLLEGTGFYWPERVLEYAPANIDDIINYIKTQTGWNISVKGKT